MLGRAMALGVVVAVASLVFLLTATRPADVGPLGVLAVFVFMYMSALGVLTLLLSGASRMIASLLSLVAVAKRPMMALTMRRSYYFSSVIALAPVMLVGMQSVGEVGFYDVVLVIVFVVVACVYVSKRTN